MKMLKKRYLDNHIEFSDVSTVVQLHTWNKPGEVICCKKGIFVFIELKNDREIMYQELCELLKKVS